MLLVVWWVLPRFRSFLRTPGVHLRVLPEAYYAYTFEVRPVRLQNLEVSLLTSKLVRVLVPVHLCVLKQHVLRQVQSRIDGEFGATIVSIANV